jgi:hypothetical protein
LVAPAYRWPNALHFRLRLALCVLLEKAPRHLLDSCHQTGVDTVVGDVEKSNVLARRPQRGGGLSLPVPQLLVCPSWARSRR